MNRRHLLQGLAAFAGGGALASCVGSTAARGQADGPQIATATNRIVINGAPVEYRAVVAETLLPATESRPAAVAITNAYIREDIADRSTRPILFAFNGGPGASSSPLHFDALGPRIFVREPDQPARLADNGRSPLDVMDLVFIDPVGTGYTRILDGEDGGALWSVMGDGEAAAEIIDAWLTAHDRHDSPRFMLGESYGGTRAAAVLRADRVRFDGVLMFAGAVRPIGPQGDDLAYMMRLPSMAAVAAFHGRSEFADRPVEEIFTRAYDYATTDYALALIKGSEISSAEAQHVAERLSALIGLPPEEIVAQDLRVGVEHYVRNLLKDDNLRIGRLDARVTGPLDAPPQDPPWDDPSMVRSEANGGATYDDYFRDEIGFVSDRPYNSLNLAVNAAWNFGSGRSGAPNYATFIAEAMEADPTLRLYSGAGYYDLGVPVAQMRYLLNHGGVPMDRVTLAYYPTGHSLFEGDENLARLTQDLRAFIRGEPI